MSEATFPLRKDTIVISIFCDGCTQPDFAKKFAHVAAMKWNVWMSKEVVKLGDTKIGIFFFSLLSC